MIHYDKPSTEGASAQVENTTPKEHESAINLTNTQQANCNDSHVLLATARIKIKNGLGKLCTCRALLDSGSQVTMITKGCCERLGLVQRKSDRMIIGVGNTPVQHSSSTVSVTFCPLNNSEEFSVEAVVTGVLTSEIPNFRLKDPNWPTLKNLKLADPEFYIQAPIDMILGADIYTELMLNGSISLGEGLPMAINTRLGWVLLGKLMGTSESNTEVCNLSLQSEPELEFVLKRFWETESVPSPDLCTQDEDCERLFSNNHGRDSHGRYWVKLPFRQHRPLLGESREKALRRFLLLERKLCKNVKLYDQYRGFMKEYEHLNHMERVPIAEVKRELCRCYYMPHHPVIREQSTTTKMRVVFDASAKSENNVSLNQFLHKGPKIQQDVFFILLRFRTYPVAITADIEKMYRQIRIHPEDADYQRILWRPSPEEPVVDYRLLTVTYGTTSAPFLAMRTLQQLAEDEGQNYPEASRVTLKDFYVDDLLTGAQTIAEAKELIDQLKDLMKKGGFHLRKWNSNCHEIVSHVEEMNEEKKINLEKGAISKILGIVWDHVQDTFRVNITLPEEVVTKRDLLSNIARIFDPLGFLSPTTVALKIIMQELWRGGTGWDEHIPNDIKEKWNNFRAELLKLGDLSIPRYVWACEKDQDVQLHGFCDASSVAYSAVCYLRTVSLDGQVHISMLAAKTRVAPCKSLTLPRLELCAALLLSQLYRSVVDSLRIDIGRAYLWSDSQISLSWIKSDPNRWKTFIHNRVVKIQQLSDRNSWRHVSGKDNPADCASRGIMPAALSGHTLWWQGPTWLKDNNFVQNQDNCYGRECHEEEKVALACQSRIQPPETFDFSTPNEWPKWRKRFERYLVVSGMKKKEEADKIDLFMYLMGDRADDIFRTFKFEKEEEATKIDSVLKAFDSHFCVRKNIIYERAKFNSRIQEDREPVDEFITSLYKLADSCEFEGLHEQLIRDRIVVGVRDKALSERMQLDSELTLEKSVKMVRQQEAVRQQQVDLQRPSTSQKVNQVKFNSKKQSPKQQQQPSRKKEKSAKTRSRCPKCGGFTHREGQACRAEGQKCNLCSKTGHFANCCPDKQAKTAEVKAVSELDEEIGFLLEVSAVEDLSNLDDDEDECRRRWTAEIQVNGKQVKFKLDSQADVTCVPLCLFKRIMGQQRLVESDINIRAAEFSELQTVGMFISTLRNGNYEIKEKIYVIRRLSEPLLSRRACELLNLARRIEVVATRINPIKEFPEVFEGLGQIGNPYEIKLKPGAKPYAVHTPRRVPIPLMEKLKTRLDIPGKELLDADALSRQPLLTTEGGENERQTSAHKNAVLSSITDKDEMLTKMSQALLSYWHVKDELGVQNGLLMRSCRLVIPASMKLEILEKLHAGHFGITKTRLRARETVWWPGISEEIAETVRKCSVCIQEAVSKHEPLIPTNFPTRPWQKIGMDLFKFENKWYLVVIDYYSRFPEMIQLDRLTASVVVRGCKSIFARHGIPETVVSDNGTQFGAAREFANFARQYGFTHVTSSPRFPQSNGMAEAGVKIAKLILKKNQDPSLGLLEYRSTPLENGYSPAELLMGRKLRTTLPIAPENLNPRLVDSQTLKRKEGRRRKDMKSRYDRRCGATDMEELSEGDTVWITDMRTWGIVKKKASTPRSYMVDTPVGTLRRNRFHLRKGYAVQYPADPSTPTFSGEELVENEKTPVVDYPSNDSEDGQIRTRSGRIVKP
ncbi:hypothetical protein LAZ67_2000471, partial [Cordylochernes scorpioides]